MAQRPRTIWRRLDGIVLLDKPPGMSSNQALQRVRHVLRAEKGGHTGALDPLATGLLPLCFGEATKIAGHLLGARKSYETLAELGKTTDSDDADGALLRERDVPPLSLDRIEQALRPLRGEILQVPPIYSALKRGGEPLYAKARRGEHIDVEARPVQVQRFELIAIEGTRLRLQVDCGSGTYVRSLVRDLGEALGCGAHVVELRRLWVEPFRSPQMVSIEQIQAEAARVPQVPWLLPLEAGLAEFPRVELDASQVNQLRRGQRIAGFESMSTDLHAAFGPDRRAVGLVQRIEAGLLASARVFAAPTH